MTPRPPGWRGGARAALCASVFVVASALGASPAIAAITEADLAALRAQRDGGSVDL